MEVYETVKTDVLVVGGGGAGMRAAIAASENGANVVMATKGQAARSGATPMACPSYQAAYAMETQGDNPELAFDDTCFEGRYLGDENLIHILTHESTDRAMDLVKYGVKYRKKADGKYLQVVHPGQSFARNLVIIGNGYAMAARLKRQMAQHATIKLLEDVVITKLLKDDDMIAGALGLDMRMGKPLVIKAPAVILATGGYPELWRWTDTEPGLTGDGLVMALKAGADLVDLEMMLFYPAGLCYPTEVEGTLVQYEGLMTDIYCGGQMLNGHGQPFLPDTKSLPVRDVMMKLMFNEIEKGRGTPHGGIYIDLRRSSRSKEEIREMLKILDSLPYNQLSDLGIDVTNEPIEVKPVTHFTIGGVRINEWAETTVPGLFAAGEVAGNIHGANRTSGNALAETQVFGARAGKRAALYAHSVGQANPDQTDTHEECKRIENQFGEQAGGIRPIEVKRKVKSLMHKHVHYRRNAKGLQLAVDKLRELRESDLPRLQVAALSKKFNYEWEEALEVNQMIDLAEVVAASAKAREESRGHHWREDFPTMRAEWEKHTIVRWVEGRYDLSDAPVIRLKDRTRERRGADPTLMEAGVLEGYQEG